jgi:hypothetical protein
MHARTVTEKQLTTPPKLVVNLHQNYVQDTEYVLADERLSAS